MQAKDKSGVPKEAQDNGLSNGISGGRQSLPRRPIGRQCLGYFPLRLGSEKKSETIDLETVVVEI